jgi:hypothetical protein
LAWCVGDKITISQCVEDKISFYGVLYTKPLFQSVLYTNFPKYKSPQKKLTLMCFYIPAMFGGAA